MNNINEAKKLSNDLSDFRLLVNINKKKVKKRLIKKLSWKN